MQIYRHKNNIKYIGNGVLTLFDQHPDQWVQSFVNQSPTFYSPANYHVDGDTRKVSRRASHVILFTLYSTQTLP